VGPARTHVGAGLVEPPGRHDAVLPFTVHVFPLARDDYSREPVYHSPPDLLLDV